LQNCFATESQFFLPRLTPAVSIIMANIDDFFAKKDKKKKGTKKFSMANTDVIAQNLEDSAKKEQLQQDKDMNNLGDEEQKIAQQDDEEWDDYRENKKDFTGLKIDKLVIEEPSAKPEEEDTEVNENGEIVKKEESGPWNKKDGERSEERESPVVETKPMPKADDMLPSVVGGAYVPPSRRGLGGESGGDARLEPMKPRRIRAAPDINSSIAFPGLSNAGEDTAPKGAWGKKLVRDEGNFEEVRGSAQNQQRSTEAPKLTLGNKFDALRDE